jgi:hypothetical protein
MTNLKEQFESAKAKKKTRSLSPEWITFDEPGKTVLGRILSWGPVASSLGSGSYNQYLMETDQGMVKFALGAAADRELCCVLHEGDLVCITYEGQVKIKGGKRCNKFDVAVVVSEDEVPASENGDLAY